MATKHKGIMDRSDIPFAQRMRMQREAEIVNVRNKAAQVAMFCDAVALNEVEGIGYKQLVLYSLHFKGVVDEFYEDPEVGMAHAKKRMEQMGRPISGEFFMADPTGKSLRELEKANHAMHAAQIAKICAAIAKNDFFGFANKRQDRVDVRAREVAAEYKKKGMGYLLDKMEKIGFRVENGQVRAYLDDDGKPVTPKQAKKMGGNYADNQD